MSRHECVLHDKGGLSLYVTLGSTGNSDMPLVRGPGQVVRCALAVDGDVAQVPVTLIEQTPECLRGKKL
jgi:hypothetical protein